ncbi:nak protein kinase [Lasallia pustulata]|uniref:non-specific serine/threonine protein kinase n=1 Tax=Lasallia pustulata TaxID=136370 RepID=A0A1W5DDF2_9LECA|nr:nak protein kinase [Lasallia pustulata]
MATTFNPAFPASPVPYRQPAYNAAATAVSAPPIPAGTFAPGTKVQVGSHRVIIEKYLSEGGFAHVYLVRLPKAVNGDAGAVLKRVAVPDKEALASMRTEVETMKKLKGHRHIVTYIDSHASQLKGGGYEVFLLMEYCNGGGLIDFMNTRLQKRLTEPEILKIFSDVAEGVACMHYLKPPLLHRDLKVENVLISTSGSSRRYKLCDFGSTAPPRPAATSAMEGRLVEDDVQKHTTLQYRSPEMIDVYRKQPIDEKSDIWALGVLLYKLCYYTTPFEELGQTAILNASFKFPGYPAFSDRVKKLIASMLRENPQLRPNIYQVLREVCLMRGTDIPIKDIYAGRSQSETRRNQHLPSPEPELPSLMVGASKAPLVEDKPSVPDVVPMRRGRPMKHSPERIDPKPSPSPRRGVASDPFAALDSVQEPTRGAAMVDEVAARFPPLDRFSLLHDSGSKFAFDEKAQPSTTQPKDISQRVTEALADEAFAQPAGSKPILNIKSQPVPTPGGPSMSTTRRKPDSSMNQTPPSLVYQPTPQKPTMVSTGTMTSPSPPPSAAQNLSVQSRPIFRFPPGSEHRSSSQPGAPNFSQSGAASLRSDVLGLKRPTLPEYRSKSQTATLTAPKSPASSRPSLEGFRPSVVELDSDLNRSRSANSRARPSSAYVESNIDFLRDRETTRNKAGENLIRSSYDGGKLPLALTGSSDGAAEPTRIESNVDFLRSMEEEDPSKRKEKRSTSAAKHIKRASMPSISLSGTKSLLAGRFGDAFRRFETNTSGDPARRTPSPSPDSGGRDLTPIAGSEATDGRSDDGNVVEELELPPEVRRELERRRLSQEEKRVANAAAEYRQRVAERGDTTRGPARGGPANRATSIQSKVQSLLNESGRSSPSPTKPEGYGRFTQSQFRGAKVQDAAVSPSVVQRQVLRKPAPENLLDTSKPRSTIPINLPVEGVRPHAPISASAPPVERHIPRPAAPPKPQALRTGGRGAPTQMPSTKAPPVVDKLLPPVANTADAKDDEWEVDFSKRYPSLSGLEMVETEIDKSGPAGIKTRDV